MTDPGLSNRLRQHSRRAGLMVGVSMALTIAICVGGFATIYAGLTPFTSDFVAQERPPTPTPTAAPAAAAPEPAGAAEVAIAATEPTPAPAPAETEAPAPTATSEAFQPTHQIVGGGPVNLRPNPSTVDPAILALPVGTPLQSLDEEVPAEDGTSWLRFRTEDGEEGWVRDIDTEPFQPDN